MEQLREIEEVAFSDPSRTRDVRISASLGAMRPLLWKLEVLLLGDAPRRCFSKNVQDGMALLKTDVENMSSYLDELSEVEDPPPTAKCWMSEAHDLSYDMEDYIDSLLFVQPAGPSIVDDETIASKLSEFSKYVQKAIERHKVYVLPDSGPSSNLRHRFVSLGPMFPRQYEGTPNIAIDGWLKGFINSVDKDEDPELKVLSVLGSSCLGKTTLARVLYNKLGKGYHCRAFIRVSKRPDITKIFRDMGSQLELPIHDQYELIDNIKAYLQGKRYLIIVDDLWDTSVWHTIKRALPEGNHGSRIIATTQIEDVALRCCCHKSDNIFEMKPLDDHHSRKLFFSRLFGSESDCSEQFKTVLSEIVEICGGLPLATVSIAGLLASQPVITVDLLTHIHQSLSSLFLANPTSERTIQALNLCFINLPDYLKTCLLYLGIYPEGYEFCVDDLVEQWVAEGLIDTREGQDVKEVARSYVHELVGRNFIQPLHMKYKGAVLTCAVHHVIHDLIAHKAAEQNFIVAIDYSQKNVALSHKVRRLSLVFGGAKYAKTPANIGKSHVRSLAYYGLSHCMPCIKKFKLLRVLNLRLFRRGHGRGYIDLNGVIELSQLRYLKIVDGFFRDELSPGVLQYLETLDINKASLGMIPLDIYFPNLLHLSLPSEDNIGKSISYSINLWRLHKLKHLEDLCITFSSSCTLFLRENMENLQNFISGHARLKTLVVACDTSRQGVISGFSKVIISWDDISPPPVLQRFEFSPYMCAIFSRIPQCFSALGILRVLQITVSKLGMECVDILRGLPALTSLSLYVLTAPYQKIIFDKDGFSVLKYFKLSCESGIACLNFQTDAMPNLSKLKLVFDATPPMNYNLSFILPKQASFEKYQPGTALISINHMPALKEIAVEFGGEVADVEYALRTFFSNHRYNPIINMPPDDILREEEPDKYDKILEIPQDKRISRTPESSPLLHVREAEAGQDEQHQTTQLDVNGEVSSSGYPPAWDGWHILTQDEFTGRKYSMVNEKGNGYLRNIFTATIHGKFTVSVVELDDTYTFIEFFNLLPELHHRGRMHHPHLVRLLGYCDSSLVYEWMPRGSLMDHLCDTNLIGSLSWLTRLKIAMGVAKGLAFVHSLPHPRSHGILSASSVLLDTDYNAKLWSFVGPEWEKPDDKSDVYNFGVVVLQLLLAGRAFYDDLLFILVNGSDRYPLFYIVDPKLDGQYQERAARSTATIVRRCLHKVPGERPSMCDLVENLEGLLAIELDDDDDRNNQPPAAPDEYHNNTLDRPAAHKRISESPESSLRLHVVPEDQAGGRVVTCCEVYPQEWEGWHKFTLDVLISATSNFSTENLLGECYFGQIYKGTVNSSKLMVTVIRLQRGYYQNWLPVLQHLQRTRHPNLVRMLGYCNHDMDSMVVYKYMPRGSLQSHLSDINSMGSIPWLTRLKIALGTAKGLAFLHESGKGKIYDGGFKASNILLDWDYTAKLWGFCLPKEKDVTTRSIIGEKTDVYNLGVVLLELLAGRPSLFWQIDLVTWARPYLDDQNKMRLIIDPSLKGKYSMSSAWTTANIASRCLQSTAEKRPCMINVVNDLELLVNSEEH